MRRKGEDEACLGFAVGEENAVESSSPDLRDYRRHVVLVSTSFLITYLTVATL